MNINKQLRLSTFFITVFALLILSLLSYWTFFQSSYSELKTNTIKSLNRSGATIEAQINEIDILTEKAQFFSKNSYDLMSDLRNYATGSEYSKEGIFYTEQEIKGIFRTLIYRMDQLNFLAIVLPNGRIISYSNTQKDFSYGYNPLNDNWYQQALLTKGELSISTLEDESIIVNGGKEKTLLFSRAIYDFYSKELLGVFVVNCEPNIFNFISKDFPDKIIGYQLTNEANDEVLYQANNIAIHENNTVRKTINARRQPLKLTVTMDNQEYVDLLLTTLINMLIIFVGVLILSLFISYRFSNLFTAPIIGLSEIMRKRSKKDIVFTTRNYERRTDEIGILYQEYHQMIEAIEQYTKEQINFEQSLLKSELNVYKNQIDSHFLYNTLESINSLAEIQEIEEISTMTLALSNMFRYASNGFVSESTLAEELQNVEDYLDIQKIRFQKKIDYLVINNSDNQLLQAYIPKIIIQPLVENAVYHGLNKGGINGKIRIFISKTKDTALIRIYDDGVGIPSDVLLKIKRDLKDATNLVRKRLNHISLINIEARIKNTYGENFGLNIYSQKEKGTLIELKLPILYKGEENV